MSASYSAADRRRESSPPRPRPRGADRAGRFRGSRL